MRILLNENLHDAVQAMELLVAQCRAWHWVHDAGFAVAGAAAGAVAGGAAGAMYEYDQHRQGNRNEVMADAIGGARKGETVDDAGKRHLDDFIGDWNISA